MTIDEAAALAAQLLESPAPFRQWIERQQADVLVGKAQSASSSPLVRFLRANGIPAWMLTDVVLQVRDENHTYSPDWRDMTVPEWTQRFNRLEREIPRFGRMTAAEARWLLDDATGAKAVTT